MLENIKMMYVLILVCLGLAAFYYRDYIFNIFIDNPEYQAFIPPAQSSGPPLVSDDIDALLKKAPTKELYVMLRKIYSLPITKTGLAPNGPGGELVAKSTEYIWVPGDIKTTLDWDALRNHPAGEGQWVELRDGTRTYLTTAELQQLASTRGYLLTHGVLQADGTPYQPKPQIAPPKPDTDTSIHDFMEKMKRRQMPKGHVPP